jgi:hypothetical protein
MTIRKKKPSHECLIITCLELSDRIIPTSDLFIKGSQKYTQYAMAAMACIGAKGVKIRHEEAPYKLNKSRAKRGVGPIFSHSVVEIDLSQIEREGPDLGGAHASPRLHWRRGHRRTLSHGKSVRVRACLVGSLASGIAHHDYKIFDSKKDKVLAP